jgi:hypothetical protein
MRDFLIGAPATMPYRLYFDERLFTRFRLRYFASRGRDTALSHRAVLNSPSVAPSSGATLTYSLISGDGSYSINFARWLLPHTPRNAGDATD